MIELLGSSSFFSLPPASHTSLWLAMSMLTTLRLQACNPRLPKCVSGQCGRRAAGGRFNFKLSWVGVKTPLKFFRKYPWTQPNKKTIFGALKHHEMARYDLPTYVLHVLGHFWMFAVKITEWIFSLKSLGLWTWTWTHLPIVWDKVPNKSVFFTPSLIG